VQEFFTFLNGIDPLYVYGIVLAVALIENLFPPSPSDIMIVAAGSLVGMERLGFPEALASATTGSVLGFIIMYKIGDWFGDHILEQGKIKFIPIESVHKVERWFVKYGYAIIVINRFLTGTRAVVSFFAGMSELKLLPTTALCFVSALFWNTILILIGVLVGQNFDLIGYYLDTYSQIVTIGVIAIAGLLVARYLLIRRKKAQSTS
jgi:membrane protein DedA with SNARE-associated domain